MKKLFFLVLVLFVAYLAEAQDKDNFRAYWDNGLKVDSKDGNFKIKMGGRIQYDVMSLHQDAGLDALHDGLSGAEFRRLRLYSSGTIYKNLKFKLQFDFAAGDAGVKDAFLELTKIPIVGNLRAGHFKQPIGLELLTSSKYVNFMERSLTNAFTPERDLGFMAHNNHLNKRLKWSLGYFYPTGGVGKYLGEQYAVSARLSGLPVYDTKDTYKVLHLGFSYSYHYHDNQEGKFAERPEAHLAPKYVSAEFDKVNHYNKFAGEAAGVYGAFSFQSEYMLTQVVIPQSSEYLNTQYMFNAFYAYVSWFITGEHKNYKTSLGAFDRITPKKNLGGGGAGAWELSVRYSTIDLIDADVDGNKMNDITVGVNWYLNPATRVSANYIYSDVVNIGKANIYQMRFQVAF